MLEMDLGPPSLYPPILEEETKDDIPVHFGRSIERNEESNFFGYLFFINKPEDEQKHENNIVWLEAPEKHVEVPIA